MSLGIDAWDKTLNLSSPTLVCVCVFFFFFFFKYLFIFYFKLNDQILINKYLILLPVKFSALIVIALCTTISSMQMVWELPNVYVMLWLDFHKSWWLCFYLFLTNLVSPVIVNDAFHCIDAFLLLILLFFPF
jgi:hypothetical protein